MGFLSRNRTEIIVLNKAFRRRQRQQMERVFWTEILAPDKGLSIDDQFCLVLCLIASFHPSSLFVFMLMKQWSTSKDLLNHLR